jgi:transcriptional regulator with XRE-family HTH domain
MISFGEFMRVTRENQGMSLRELARRLDVVPSYVSQVERDLASIPTEPRLLIIANELNIDGDELMAKAGRVPSDIADAFIANPKGVSSLIRRAVKQGFR